MSRSRRTNERGMAAELKPHPFAFPTSIAHIAGLAVVARTDRRHRRRLEVVVVNVDRNRCRHHIVVMMNRLNHRGMEMIHGRRLASCTRTCTAAMAAEGVPTAAASAVAVVVVTIVPVSEIRCVAAG